MAALALIAVGWALRLRNLAGSELWFDEAASHFIAVRSPVGILTYVASAPFEHPPLYYLLLHGAMRLFGDGEWAMRFPSVLLGVVLVAGLWRAGESLGGPGLGLTVLGFAAVSPFLVTYAQEARMYALLQCLGLLSTALLHRALVRRGWAAWGPYGLVMALGLSTHYFFAFLLPAHALIAVILTPDRPRQALRNLVLAGTVVVAVGVLAFTLLPGPRSAAEQMIREALWGKSPEDVARLVLDWAYGGAIITSRPAWAGPLSTAALVPPILGLVTTTLPRRIRATMAIWVAVPTVIAVVIPYGGLVLRHFSYVAPALCLLAGAGLLALFRRSTALGVAGILLVALTGVPGLTWLVNDKGHYREAVLHIGDRYRSGDLVLLANPHQWVPFTYYARADLDVRPVGDGRTFPAADIASADRVWLLEWETWAVADMGQVRDQLREVAVTAYSLDLSQDVRVSLLYPLPTADPRVLPGWSWSDTYRVTEASLWGDEVRPGDAVIARLFWSPDPPEDDEAVVVLRLTDDSGRVWAEFGRPARENRPTTDDDCCTYQALTILGGTPPGTYRAELGLVETASGAQPAATRNDGTALGPWVPLGEIELVAADYPAPTTVPGTGGRLDDKLELMGSETDRTSLSAGAYWDGLVQVRPATSWSPNELGLRLVGGAGDRDLGTWSPCAGQESKAPWTAGETRRCPLTVRLPADLPAGDYRLRVSTGRTSGFLQRLPWSDEGSVTIDTFTVTTRSPNTVDTRPSVPLNVQFGTGLRLYGLDQESNGEHLRLTLYWETLAPMGEIYKTFVHLARPGEGSPLAQDDRPPSSLPTTEWLPGEMFASEHLLDLPRGESSLRLRIGVYSERTMERLPATGPAAQSDHLELVVEPGGLIRAP